MKSKGHIYMANLIMKELKKKSTVTIEGVGNFAVPEDVRNAILQAPKAFRAGAVGPDFYPDMITGQMTIHPSNSGKWLAIMEDELKMTSRKSSEWTQAYAFYLGYMMHYANDMWTHDYVNTWSGGSFPGVSDIASKPASALIAVKHILIESYIDNKISSKESMEIEAPVHFIQRCFTSPAARKLYGSKTILGFMLDYRDAVNKQAQNNTSNMLDIVNYFSSWKNEIDRAILEWFRLWNQIAKDFLLDDGGMTQAKEHFKYWLETYAVEATAIPVGLIRIVKAVGVLAETIEKIFEPIKEMFKQILYQMVYQITGIRITDIEKLIAQFQKAMKNPALYLNSGILFKSKGVTKRLDKECGNFGKDAATPYNQSLICFHRALNMARLAVMGSKNLNTIMKRYHSSVTFTEKVQAASVSQLSVTIKTANKLYAGTDDNIYFGIVLKSGQVMEKLFDKAGYNDFERGDKDTYSFTLPETVPYSKISKIQLRKDYIKIDDDWTIASMVVKDTSDNFLLLNTNQQLTLKKRKKYYFPVTKKANGGKISVDAKVLSHVYSLDVATPNKQPGYKSWQNCFLSSSDKLWREFTVPVFKLNS